MHNPTCGQWEMAGNIVSCEECLCPLVQIIKVVHGQGQLGTRVPSLGVLLLMETQHLATGSTCG